MVGILNFPQVGGKLQPQQNSFLFPFSIRKARLQVFLLYYSPPLGTIGESIAAIRRFHSLRSFHQRLLKVGPLRGPNGRKVSEIVYRGSFFSFLWPFKNKKKQDNHLIKKGEKVRIFKCYTSSPYFYGWVGNIISCIELNHLAIIKARNADDAISCSI